MELVLDRCNEVNFVNSTGISAEQIQEQRRETFSDIQNHWALEPVERMTTMGVMTGYKDGTFRPEGEMTRGEFAVVIARAFGFRVYGQKTELLDVAPGQWYTDAVQALYTRGIVKGRPDGTFGVNKPLTTEEMAVILWRVFNQLAIPIPARRPYGKFRDEKHISSFAKDAVKVIYEGNLLYFKKSEALEPKKPVGRAQVAAVLDRILTLHLER